MIIEKGTKSALYFLFTLLSDIYLLYWYINVKTVTLSRAFTLDRKEMDIQYTIV